jgi:hypothetical protein
MARRAAHASLPPLRVRDDAHYAPPIQDSLEFSNRIVTKTVPISTLSNTSIKLPPAGLACLQEMRPVGIAQWLAFGSLLG